MSQAAEQVQERQAGAESWERCEQEAIKDLTVVLHRVSTTTTLA